MRYATPDEPDVRHAFSYGDGRRGRDLLSCERGCEGADVCRATGRWRRGAEGS